MLRMRCTHVFKLKRELTCLPKIKINFNYVHVFDRYHSCLDQLSSNVPSLSEKNIVGHL